MSINNFNALRSTLIRLSRPKSLVHLNPSMKKKVFGLSSNMRNIIGFVLIMAKMAVQNLGVKLLDNQSLLKVTFLVFTFIFRIAKKESKVCMFKVMTIFTLAQNSSYLKKKNKC